MDLINLLVTIIVVIILIIIIFWLLNHFSHGFFIAPVGMTAQHVMYSDSGGITSSLRAPTIYAT